MDKGRQIAEKQQQGSQAATARTVLQHWGQGEHGLGPTTPLYSPTMHGLNGPCAHLPPPTPPPQVQTSQPLPHRAGLIDARCTVEGKVARLL